MGSLDRLTALRDKHTFLDAEITRETRTLHPDLDHIAELKKQKLRVKDAIAALSREPDTVS